ncbi:hypothetical protein EP47_02665, partial [Legionella norrlandica]
GNGEEPIYKMRWIVFLLIPQSLYFIASSMDICQNRDFLNPLLGVMTLFSTMLLLASCAPSTTTND